MLKSESLLVHGEYIKVSEGMFHTYIELSNGEEIQLDVDYDDLLKLLDKQMGNFESMATQLDDPVNMAQAIVMDTMMRKLNQLMDRLVGYIITCNAMIEAQQFSPQKALLLEKLEANFSYDVVCWDDLDHAFDNPYLVAKVSDVLDEDYDQNYYPLHCLRLEGFDDKVSAYKYMLAHGISKENLILRW